MTRNKIRSLAFVSSIALAAIVFGSPAVKRNSAAADAPPTNDQLKSLYEEKCSACHDVPDPEEKGFTKAQWLSTVNRMLNEHGARSSISDVQAGQIVDYLGQFAPKPQQGGALSQIGVWETDPAQSVAYPFTYGPNLDSFDIHGGVWKVIPAADIVSGYLKAYNSQSNSAVIVENKTNFQGALDARCQYRVNTGSPNATLGILFGASDSANYLAAEFTPTTSLLQLIKVEENSASVLQQTTVDSSQVSTSNWHDIRVKVSEGGAGLEVWLDYQKQIKTTYPQWSGGHVGLLTSGPITAGFRQLTADSYQSESTSPAGDIMLH
jgi:hypothetical protein